MAGTKLKTPRKRCPQCSMRRVLYAVEKLDPRVDPVPEGSDFYRCMCRPCLVENNHAWEESA